MAGLLTDPFDMYEIELLLLEVDLAPDGRPESSLLLGVENPPNKLLRRPEVGVKGASPSASERSPGPAETCRTLGFATLMGFGPSEVEEAVDTDGRDGLADTERESDLRARGRAPADDDSSFSPPLDTSVSGPGVGAAENGP
jgi:hypothetical protein